MTIALAFQSERAICLLAVNFPPYRPSSLLAVILALALAIVGLASDVALGLPVGVCAMWFTAFALGVVLAVLSKEVFLWPSEPSPRF